MSSAAQHYLKVLLNDLKVIAWQRKGGLSTDLLAGEYENRASHLPLVVLMARVLTVDRTRTSYPVVRLQITGYSLACYGS